MTLVELLVVVVIIGVISAVAFVGMSDLGQKAEDKEAISILRLLEQVEEMYMDNTDLYVACGVGACETAIGASIPVGETWNYKVDSDGTSFCIEASHTKISREWRLRNIDAAPSQLACP